MRLAVFIVAILGCLSAPSAAQEREWILDAADEDTFLVFGVPETDDVGVSFWCRIGSGKVKLYFPEGSASLQPNASAKLTVSVNGKEHILAGTTSANDMTGATSIESELPDNDVLFTELQGADRFTAVIADHSTTYPLIESGFGNFIRLCKAK
jgi:hypothetical protein